MSTLAEILNDMGGVEQRHLLCWGTVYFDLAYDTPMLVTRIVSRPALLGGGRCLLLSGDRVVPPQDLDLVTGLFDSIGNRVWPPREGEDV